MADQGSLSARDVHIQWSFVLPGLQVCQFEGGQEASWFSESLLSPCAFLFCQTGGMQFYLDHGQVIDLNPHDILLLSAGACIQRIQSAAPCSCGIRMTLDGEEALCALTKFWPVPGTRLQAEQVDVCLQAHGGWLLFPSGLWNSAFFSQLTDLPTDKRGEYCVLTGVELLYLLCGKGLSPMGHRGRRYWDRDQIEAIRQAHDYMLANLGQPLTIEGLARRFHISGTFLKEGFRQMYGQSTRKFLQMRRMDKASELLRTTNQTVLQIAVAVGYESASQFSQIFKRHYQLPPAQYRRQIIKRNV